MEKIAEKLVAHGAHHFVLTTHEDRPLTQLAVYLRVPRNWQELFDRKAPKGGEMDALAKKKIGEKSTENLKRLIVQMGETSEFSAEIARDVPQNLHVAASNLHYELPAKMQPVGIFFTPKNDEGQELVEKLVAELRKRGVLKLSAAQSIEATLKDVRGKL